MSIRINIRWLLGFFIAGVITFGTWATVRAHSKLVTLKVRNMDVRQVVKKIEWQTWESILVQSNVQGRVTLDVRKVPLERVLAIVGEQTSSRSSVVYPLYSSRESLASLKKVLRGDVVSASGWTNLQSGGSLRGEPMFGGGGGPSASEMSSNQLISMQIREKDIVFTSLAFNRFAHARILAEDGIKRTVNLELDKATVHEAITKLAQKVNRRWTKLYTLRKQGRPGGSGGPVQMAALDSNSPVIRARGERKTPEAETEEARAKREELQQQLMQVLPVEEREKLEQAQLERKQQLETMLSLTPEQRREIAPQMTGRNMGQAMLDRIKNSTPEQRAQQRRQMAQMRPPAQTGQFSRQ